MSTKEENEQARGRVEALVAVEMGRPHARERAVAYRSLVKYYPGCYCAPSDKILRDIGEALTEYENLREQAGAHVKVARNHDIVRGYLDTAITEYERARRGEV